MVHANCDCVIASIYTNALWWVCETAFGRRAGAVAALKLAADLPNSADEGADEADGNSIREEKVEYERMLDSSVPV